MKRFLAMAVVAIATTVGTSDTAEAQFGRFGGRGYTISVGGGRGLGVSYSRFSGFNRGFNRGVGFNRGIGFNRGVGFNRGFYQPVYVGRPVYGGGYYGGGFYGGGRGCYRGW